MPAVSGGIAQDRILAGDIGKAPEVGDIGELRATGRDALVAPGADREGVYPGDGANWRFQQRQHGDAVDEVVRQYLGLPPDIGPAGPVEGAEGEPAGGEAAKPGGGKRAVAQNVDDRTGALVGWGFEIDPAARIAESCIAARLKRPPDGLAQHMCQ